MVSRRDFLKYILGAVLGISAAILGVTILKEIFMKINKENKAEEIPIKETPLTINKGEKPSLSVGDVIELPPPSLRSGMEVEESIGRRRSIRSYLKKPLSLQIISQLLWAAQGITEPRLKFRAAPSAGATYPLEVYVHVKEGGVIDLPAGIYKYNPYDHSIKVVRLGDYSKELYEAALWQQWVLNAPINIIITAIYERTTRRYGKRGIRYVHMEVGHVGENIYLQSVALGLGTVAIGAFYDDRVWEILGKPKNEHPLYIMPVGYRT